MVSKGANSSPKGEMLCLKDATAIIWRELLLLN